MKAIQITETGGPEVLKYVELPTPRPGPGEVLVKAHALYGRLEGPPTGSIDAAIERPPWRSAGYRRFTMHTLDDWPELRARCTHELIRLLHNGTIKVPIYERIPLAEAARAHRVFESGRVMGKLIMKP